MLRVRSRGNSRGIDVFESAVSEEDCFKGDVRALDRRNPLRSQPLLFWIGLKRPEGVRGAWSFLEGTQQRGRLKNEPVRYSRNPIYVAVFIYVDSLLSRQRPTTQLPTVVGERFVGVGHTVSVVLLLDGTASKGCGINELGCQALTHGFLSAGAGELN